jgi:hypothetical protein
MAHIHLTGTLVARAEEDVFTRAKSFYVRLTDGQATRVYLPAFDAEHAQAIAVAINAKHRAKSSAASQASTGGA